MITMRELGWIAGLLEGEGWFGVVRGKDLRIQVVMTDLDVINRLHSVLGFGFRKDRILPSGKTAHLWGSANQVETAGLMMTLLPFMGERRSAAIKKSLALWKDKPLPKAMWSRCKNGHELSGDNLWITHEGKYEKRRCRECSRLRQVKYRAKQEKPLPVPRILSTHCKNGHELSGDNLAIAHDGKYQYRGCRECNRLKAQKHRAKLRSTENDAGPPS